MEAPAADVAREEPIGDVLFGELFTSDRIPSGTERLGSDAAPLVPGSGGASGALINGPVGRNARGSGRVLNRFDRGADTTVVDHGSTVSVSLTDGWCWAALGDEARPIEVATEGTTLQCPAATTVLVAVDDTGRFMVVVRGEAALSAGGRRIRLRAGAMAFLPHGSDEAQVDVASEIEVADDPLVALNLDLDAKR